MQKVTVFNYAQQYGEEPFTGYMDEDDQMWLDRDQTNRLMAVLERPNPDPDNYTTYVCKWIGGYQVHTVITNTDVNEEFERFSDLMVIDGKTYYNLRADLWWGVPMEGGE